MTRPLDPPEKKNPLVPSRAPTPLPPARSRAALGLAVGAAEGRFRLQVCEDCGAVQYPPRDLCGKCLSGALKWREVARGGAISAMTVTRVASELYFRDRQPWRMGLVELDAGARILAHLHGDCRAGDRVRLDLKLDPAGRGAIFAAPEQSTPHQEDDPELRAFTADPKFRNALIVDGRASTAAALAQAFFDAGAARVFVGVAETWKPHGDPAGQAALEIMPLDVTDPRSVADLADRLGDKVDILVNNADYFRPGGLIDGQDAAKARMTFEIHCLGAMRLAAAFGPVMRGRAAETGRAAAAFVNIISAWSLSGAPEYGAYAASQAALRSLSHGLRSQMRPSGLKVVDVLTGPIDDKWRQTIRPPKVAPAALAAALIAALREGREEVVVGEIAKEIHAKWAEDAPLFHQETL
jgi:NAD(P)-dependent dehydrogenase (short-subunit alcohol dehydrogenase family)/uncharacterized OB-fold protein